MALFALDQNVFPGKCEAGLPVIECSLFPVIFLMTGFALLAFLPLVLVVFLVAGVTIRLQLILVKVSPVAFGALEWRTMLAEQRKFSLLVVIEQEFLPALFVVARFALRPVLALVRFVIVLLVARYARHLQLVLVYVTLVTCRAFNRRQMLAEQRKFGLLVVVEQKLFPVFFSVAGFALRPELALVRLVVVLLVARHASRLQFVLVQVALMTSSAFNRGQVLAQQRKFGLLAMIEQNLLPASIGMAGLALHTELALVRLDIVLLVATAALQRRLFEFVIAMATRALYIHMFAQQRKVGFAVVEVGCLPVLFLMAISTLFTQAAFVLVGLFMATDAFGWRLPVFFLREMAVLAKDLFFQMPALQDKASDCVVKTYHIKFGDVRVSPSVLGMALLAFLFFLHQAVIALLFSDILLDLLVTIFA